MDEQKNNRKEDVFGLTPFEQGEEKLFFRLEGEAAERHGAVGYMRADFGRGGDGFYTTWFDNQRHLKTPAFKGEFDNVIQSLRGGIFNDCRSLESYCQQHAGQRIGDRGVGFKVQTDAYTYCFRCNPTPHDYDIYVFAFDNRFLLPELAGHHGLPNYCFCVLPSTGEMIRVVRGETGYYPCNSAGMSPETIRFKVNDENQLRDVTRAQEEAMLAGSMFGWDSSAAKPWSYNQDGTPRRLPSKKEEPERA